MTSFGEVVQAIEGRSAAGRQAAASRRQAQGAKQQKAAAKLGVKPGDVFWVSAETGAGIPELRAHLASMLGG